MEYMADNPGVCSLTTNILDTSTGMSHCQGYEKYAWSGNAEHGYVGHFLLGGGAIMRRKCLAQVEGYPEAFFWGREEADLSLQLLAKGCTLVYHPSFVTIHDRSTNGIKGGSWVYYYTRNPIWTALAVLSARAGAPAGALSGPCAVYSRTYRAASPGPPGCLTRSAASHDSGTTASNSPAMPRQLELTCSVATPTAMPSRSARSRAGSLLPTDRRSTEPGIGRQSRMRPETGCRVH